MWTNIYGEFLAGLGLRLRPGITLVEFTNILTSLFEGVILRHLADPDARAIDHENRRCLMGTAGLALLSGCTEPDAGTPGKSVRAFAESILRRRGDDSAGE